MSENTLERTARALDERLETSFKGEAEPPDAQPSAASPTPTKVRDAIGAVQDAVSGAANSVSDAAAKVGDHARSAYAGVNERAQRVAEHVDPLVHDQPYVALCVAAAAGLLVGLLIAGRGPKIVYVRPPA
jgi:ElaB/YqjD/DUF883 family membrane-anchored ribosome-binding protein